MGRYAAVLVFLLLLRAGGSASAEDPELERLKAAASTPVATLSVRKTVQERNGSPVDQTDFVIDTGARAYTMRYKTFRGAASRRNAKELNDWCSGYGMIVPHQNWYHNGFVKVDMVGRKRDCIRWMEGKPRVLESSGTRIAFDLVFSTVNGKAVVRTVALAGRPELYLSVNGRLFIGDEGALRTTFCGYPHGYNGPFDRWVHRDGEAIQNDGKERKQIQLDLQAAPWLLLADHALDPAGIKQGLLGLVYDRAPLTKALVLHNRNYMIMSDFTGPLGVEQRYIVHTFGPVSREIAKAKLADLETVTERFSQAFDGLPPALGN
ncbi:MAG: hypothetical protein HOJ57_13355 [Lentisphaerae bacterium]|jgi:hypothetical protein|nr:hypothetical protein [Lentisphaerota bacterium]MBT5606922.1 hypothetical protein [Lentisphaerota bacterium]MBT7054505.1 hypothetical protein [Lentisphaerota bacterium]